MHKLVTISLTLTSVSSSQLHPQTKRVETFALSQTFGIQVKNSTVVHSSPYPHDTQNDVVLEEIHITLCVSTLLWRKGGPY